MKRELILSAAILSFLAVAPAYAQEQEKEKPQETKPAQAPNEEHKPTDTKKKPKQQTQAPKEQQQSKEQQKQDEKSAKQQQQTQKQQDQSAKQPKEQDKARQGVAKQQEQENQQQTKEQKQVAKQQEQQDKNQRQQAGSDHAGNGGQRGKRIPDDRFRAHFGHEHHFRVAREGGNHFAYGGYTFEFVDAWPVGWAYTDDCYIEEIGGVYYLFDAVHPDVRIVVIVVG